jgi:NhaA family Na+:H+ antiporter
MLPQPSRAARFVRRVRRPLDRFLHLEAASGILLLAAAAVALLWANSPLAPHYHTLWQTSLGVGVGGVDATRPLSWWVNDVLMVLFFFVVGLEIRREVAFGELATWRRAALPAAAALGGMLAPAAMYVALADAPEARAGWGVPMATDIAFAVGVLTLLGRRAPPALRVLLLALAVIDDLGAILVIALFYSTGIAPLGLAVAGAGLGAIVLMQRLGVGATLAYVAPAVVVWGGIYSAGVHPTIAGVLVGLLTPVRAPDGTEPPTQRLIHALHPWVAFGIMPVFALANAGVHIDGGLGDGPAAVVTLAVMVGLVLGKPAGVLAACALVLRLRLATLPIGLTWAHLAVLGVVAGIGFTMSLFVAQLAFADATLLTAAKLGVLVASGVAALTGLALGFALLRDTPLRGAATTADEAERSTQR